MRTTVTEQNGSAVAALEGRLDTASATQTEQDMQAVFDHDCKEIIIDCTKLEYISSSGLRIFLGVLKKAKAQDAKVYIKGLSEDIRKVFQITGFISLFEYK